MQIRLLVVTPDSASLQTFESLLRSALELTPLSVAPAHVSTSEDLLDRVDNSRDDVIVLDWLLAHERTPDLVRDVLARNPRLRIVALLPLSYRQYRREVWQAGACSSIAKEHMEQEWLSSVLCIMHRAMEREARLLAMIESGQSTTPEVQAGCCQGAPIEAFSKEDPQPANGAR